MKKSVVKAAINVLSLFDGISCGQLALKRAGIRYNKYYACEKEKHPMVVTQSNFPNTIQLGLIEGWKKWDIDWSSIGLIFAGFPCQAWSTMGKEAGDDDPRGALVHDLIKVWKKVKKHNPNVKIIFENVKMKKAFISYINNLFGHDAFIINSNLLTAQNRERYYWILQDIEQPANLNIKLEDVLDADAANLTPANYSSSGRGEQGVQMRYYRTEKCYTITKKGFSSRSATALYNMKGNIKVGKIHRFENKKPKMKSGLPVKLGKKLKLVRGLSCTEYERLQTLPVGYTDCIPDHKRKEVIGDGWTVDVISHILKQMDLPRVKKLKREAA